MINNPNKYKVLMLGWEFSPIIAGGLGVVCRSISTNLSNLYNTQITYVLPRLPNNISFGYSNIVFKNADIDSNIKFIEVGEGLNSPYYNSMHSIDFQFSDKNISNSKVNSSTKLKKEDLYGFNLLKEVEAYTHKVERLAKEENFDLVHNHDWMTAPAAAKIKQDNKKPMIMHVHATEMERTLDNPNPLIFEAELLGMESADKIIAVSERTKQKIIDNYAIKEDKIIVVHNAIDRVEKKYGPIAKSVYKNDRIVLFLARMTAMKGANYLLEAAKHVLKFIPNTKFLFVGGGELLEELIELSVTLQIAHKVTFTGFLHHDQVDRVYSHADVFVMPSVTEPFGITPLEAIKNGTPVIISKQSGVNEVLKNVLKVDFWDTEELANKIIAVLKYGVLAEELMNNSKRDLENLSWKGQTKKILDIYKEIKQDLNYQFE